MDPFDLLLLRLVSISEANIDPFKQSNLIEGRPCFLGLKNEVNNGGSEFYPHNNEKLWLCHLLPGGKVDFLLALVPTVMGTLGGAVAAHACVATY